MMNRRIRSMIDELFSEMKMTAENLALRDELMANAIDRFDDAVAQGMDEEEAFALVASSLEDVYGLLEEMNRMDGLPKEAAEEEAVPELKTGVGDETPEEAPKEEPSAVQTDLGDALNKAFTALGGFTQAIMPEAKKFVREVDDATGGVLKGLGKAAKKGLSDAQKAASDAIDRLSGEKGELVFDFGPKKTHEEKEAAAPQTAPEAAEEPAPAERPDEGANDRPEPVKAEPEETEKMEKMEKSEEPEEVGEDNPFAAIFDEADRAEERGAEESGDLIFSLEPKEETGAPADSGANALREQAADLRAQAAIKDVTGDPENAKSLRVQAETLEAQADLLEQSEAVRAAQEAAKDEAAEDEAAEDEAAEDEARCAAPEEAEQTEDPAADGVIDEHAFEKAVDDLAREAEEAVRMAGEKVEEALHEVEYIVRGANEPVSGTKLFAAPGLRRVDIQLDADDVEILPSQGAQIETLWEARNVDGEPVITLENHTLTIRRKNPDVFKTFFSVIQKNGGRITVRIPRGYAADYQISTTSGDVSIGAVDADGIKVTTTSGDVRVEPDAQVRAGSVSVTTVSGCATVSACADDIAVTTVSGDQFVSCDALKVDVNVVSGRVHAEGASDEWEVSAVSSEVELLCTVAPTKRVSIESMHGTVHLALPGDIRGFVAESKGALGCEIVNEFGANRYGTCALPIRMETMRGTLMITRL